MAELTVVGQVEAVERMVGSLPVAGTPLLQLSGSSQFVEFPPTQFVCPHAPAAARNRAAPMAAFARSECRILVLKFFMLMVRRLLFFSSRERTPPKIGGGTPDAL
jgi:hypothetical protein